MKFEITVDTSAYDQSTLPEGLRPERFLCRINGHGYAASRDSASDAIARSVALFAKELDRVDAQSLFDQMAKEGDFALTPAARAEAQA